MKVDEKSDVYSFGVVLLELLTGKKPVGEFGEGVDIVQWVRKLTDLNKEEVLKILDPRLQTVPLEEVMHVFYVSMLCVEEQSVERPTMRDVVQILTELPSTTTTPTTTPMMQGEESREESSASAVAVAAIVEAPGGETGAVLQQQQQRSAPQSPPPDLLSI